MAPAKLGNYLVHYSNSEEYHRLKQEIFTQDCYYFETKNPSPVIIDAGSHIGLATLYFKKLYPSAQIIAVEPYPENLKPLEQNIFENRLEDVTVIPAALDVSTGNRAFYSDRSNARWFSTASFIPGAWTQQQQSTEQIIPTIPLSNLLTQHVDFLKMDIEGIEQAVLTAAGEKLRNIQHMMIEFHPVAHQSQETLVEFLKKLGFTVTIWKDGKEANLKKVTGLVLVEAIQK